MTVSQAILREAFPRHEQGVAMGVYGMGVVLAPALGPTLGGWLTDEYAWPWICDSEERLLQLDHRAGFTE